MRICPVGQALAIELVQRRPWAVWMASRLVPTYFSTIAGGDLEGDDVLDDHAGGGDGADVGAFVGGGLGRLGRHVDRRPARRQGADRLLGGADDDRLAVGRPALDPAGVVGRPAEAEAAVVGRRGRARSAIGSITFEPGRRAASIPRPISTALIAWMLITASGQPGVELAVPLGVAPQADRAAGRRSSRRSRPACRRPPAPRRSPRRSPGRPRG